MQVYSTVNSYATLAFNNTLNRNTLISGVCQFLILLYIAKLSPNVPESVEKVFKNVFFRIGIFTLIFLFAKIDFIVATLLSFAFVITMNLIQNKSALESFGDYVKYVEEEGYEPFDDEYDEDEEYEPFDDEYEEDDEYEPFDDEDETMGEVTGIKQSDTVIKVEPSVTNGVVTVPNVIVSPLTMTSSTGEQAKVIPNVIVTKEPIKKVKKARKPFNVVPYNSCF